MALSIIAVLVLVSQFVIQLTIRLESGDSTVINIAGRQRMLSQRISKCSFGLSLAKDDMERVNYLEELKISVDLWELSHNGLQYGNKELGLPGRNSDTVILLFLEADSFYKKILKASKDIIVQADKKQLDINYNLEILKENEQSFLKLMDAIVFQYNKEAKKTVLVIQITEVILMFFTFIVLALEARFIFLPAERSIEKIFKDLTENQDNIQKLFEIAPTALFLIRLQDLKVLQMNALAKGVTDNAINDDGLSSILRYFENNLENDSDLLRKMLEGQDFAQQEAVLKSSGSLKEVLVSASNISYHNTPAIILSMMDISRQKHVEAILKKYATIDELTGLLNRRSGKVIMDNAVEISKAKMQSLCVCFCDIDGLKYVNDNFGHEEGDWYIIAVAEAIKQNLREDDFAFRYGGDEIIIVLNNCDEQQSVMIIKRINNSIESKKSMFEKTYNMSVSIGTANFLSKETTTSDDLITMADNLMYEEKKRKKMQRID
jgi:diguanylate cyclase (GGDEF)-like protein